MVKPMTVHTLRDLRKDMENELEELKRRGCAGSIAWNSFVRKRNALSDAIKELEKK